MPKQLNIDLTVNANVDKAKAAIADLQDSLRKIGSAGSINSANKIFDVKTLKEASEAARELQRHLASATDVNTGKINLGQFSASLKKSGTDLAAYQKKLEAIGPTGEKAFAKLANNIAMAENPTKRVNAQMQQFATTLRNTARWQISSSILHGFMGALQSAYGYAQDLNKSLNNIRIVTGASVEEMSAFADRANKAAQALSTTTTAYTDAALIYYQQGIRDQEEIAGRTETTIKLANVSRQSAEEVSQQMTAIWNNFYDGSKSLEYYADAITALGATTASSSEEIATGLEKFAAISKTVGLSYEYATAALATITAQTRQSAETVGTGLRTLFSRLEGLKLGETLEDGVDLNKYSKALDAVGVQVLDVTGEMRNMDDILDDLGQRWDQLTQAQKMALAQTVGGVRQYTNLIALMDNWEKMQANVLTAQGSEGTLEKQAQTYAESWEAAQKRVRAAAEAIYGELLNDKFFIGLTNALAEALKGLNGFIDGMGGLQGVLLTVAALVSQHFAKEVPALLGRVKEDLFVISGEARQVGADMQAAVSQLAHKESQSQLGEIRRGEGGSMELAMNLELTSKIAEQKRILNENEAKYSQAEKQHAQEVINGLISQREELMALGKSYDQAKAKTDQLYDSLYAKLQNRPDNAMSFVDEAMVAKAKGAIETINTSLTDLKGKFDALDPSKQTFSEIGMSAEDARAHLSEMAETVMRLEGVDPKWEQWFNELNTSAPISEERLKSIAEEMRKVAQTDTSNLTNQLDNVKKSIEGLKLPPQIKQQILEYISAMEQLGKQSITIPATMRNVIAAAGKLETHMKSSAESIVKISGALMQFSAVLTSVKRLKDVFSNEDATTIEKISAVIGTLTTVSMLYKTVADAELVTKGLNIVATWQEAAAKVAATGATGLLAKAQAGLNAVMLANPVLGVVAAITALVFIIYKLVQAHNKEARAAKAAAKEAEEYKQKADEAKKAADDLRATIDNYDSCVEKLAECTKGTQEWRDALREAGTAALETMDAVSQYLTPEEYQQLIAYYREHKELDQDLVELAQERADAEAAEAQYASAVADKHATDADITARRTELSRQIASEQGFGPEKDGESGRATASQISANLDKLLGSSDVEDFKSRLQEIGVNVSGLSNTTLLQWRNAVEEMAGEAQAAAQKLQLLAEAEVERLLGDKAENYSSAEKGYAASQYNEIKDLPEAERAAALDDLMAEAQGYTATFGEKFMQSLVDGLDSEAKTVDMTGFAQSLTGPMLERLSAESDPEAIIHALGLNQDELSKVAESLGVPVTTIMNNIKDSVHEAAEDYGKIGEESVANIFKEAFKGLSEDNALTAEAKQQLAQNIHDAFEAGGEDAARELIGTYDLLAESGKSLTKELTEGNEVFQELYSTLEQIDNLDFNTVTEEIKSLNDILSSVNQVGDTISAEEFDKLPENAREYFSINSEGEYELIGSAQEFKDIIESTNLDKLKELSGQLSGEQDVLNGAADMTENGTNLNQAASMSVDAKNGGAWSVDTEQIQMQIDLIRQYGEELGVSETQLSNWTNALINHNATAGEARGYLEEMQGVLDQTDFSIEGLNERIGENAVKQQEVMDATAMTAEDFDDLQEMLNKGEINTDAFNKKWKQMQNDLGEGIDVDELEDMADYLEDNADQIDEVSDQLKVNKKATRDVAKEIARFDRGIQSVTENMETWQDQLDSGDIQEQSQAITGLRDTFGDLLDVTGDSLSDNFVTSAENMELMQRAAEGDSDAYDQLMQNMQSDIIGQVGMDDTDFHEKFGAIENKIAAGVDDLEIGAYVDDAQAIQAMNELINAAGFTADQATSYLASMGVDAEVETVTVPKEKKEEFVSAVPEITYDSAEAPTLVNGEIENTTIQVPKIQYHGDIDSETAEGEDVATALRVTSARKSSGGGFKFNNSTHGGGSGGGSRSRGGGGGGRRRGGGSRGRTPPKLTRKRIVRDVKPEEEKKNVEKYEKEEAERYHVIKNVLEDINSELDKYSEAADRAFGKNKFEQLQKLLGTQKDLVKAQQQYVKEIEANAKKDEKNLTKKGTVSYWDEVSQTTKTTNVSAEKYLGAKVEFEGGNIANYEALWELNEQKMKEAVESYNGEEEALVKNMNELNKLKAAAETKINQADDDIDRIKKDLEDKKDDLTKSQKDQLNAELAEAKKSKKDAEKELKGLNKQYENLEKQRDINEQALAEAQAQHDGFQDMVDQYEETHDLLNEERQKLTEDLHTYYDMLLQGTEYLVDLRLSVNEDKMKTVDFLLNQIGDSASKAAERIALLGKKADIAFSNMEINAGGITGILNNHLTDKEKESGKAEKLVAGMLNGTTTTNDILNAIKDKSLWTEDQFTEKEIEDLRQYSEAYLEEVNNLTEYRLQVIEEIGTVMEDHIEQLDRVDKKMSHLKTVANSYKNIVDLTGQSYLEISSEIYDQMEATNVQLSTQSLEMAKARKEDAEERLAILQREYASVANVLSDAEKEGWQQQLKDAEDYVQEMTENYYSSWEEAIQAVNTRFESAMRNMATDFKKMMSAQKDSNLDLAQQMYDLEKQNQAVYVADYEKRYQLNKLLHDAQSKIDETTNVKVKQELLKIQQKIVDATKNENKMSQYQLDYLRKELELKAAQMAMEEAARVKSQVRMTRDNEGNFSYVYTADEKAVEKAEEDYGAKLYEMQKLNEEYIASLQDQLFALENSYIQAMQEAADKYGIGTKEYYRAVDEIQTKYNTYFQELTGELNIALHNQQEVATVHAQVYEQLTGDTLQANADLTDSWDKTLFKATTGFTTLQNYQDAWKLATVGEDGKGGVLGDVKAAADQWKKDMDAVYDKAGTSIDQFSGKMSGDLKNITKEGDNLRKLMLGDGKDDKGLLANLQSQFAATASKVTSWEKTWSEKIGLAEGAAKNLKTAVDDLVTSLSNIKEKYTYSIVEETPKSGGDSGGGGNSGGGSNTAAETKAKNNQEVNNKREENNKNNNNNNNSSNSSKKNGSYNRVKAVYDLINTGKVGNEPQRTPNLKKRGYSATEIKAGQRAINLAYGGMSIKNAINKALKEYAGKFNTGGYTGSWAGSEGKLAVLHQKELVLNAKDTENMLAIVNMVRDIAKVIDINAMSAGSGLNALSAPGVKSAKSDLEQQVHITAEFPNATDRNEILAAFDNVINLASQYANRR